jgi:hypothetical protein
MAEGPDVSEILRRTVQANARLYKGWVDISLDYWRGMGEIFGVAPPSGPDATATEEADETGMVVLEAEAGATARGAFLVTNDLGRTVRCDLVASDITGPQGAAAGTKVTFDPPNFELAPGEQRVVTATTIVDGTLAAGAAYTGTISIRGMDGFSVPFVLRRTHSMADAERAAKRSAAAGTKDRAGDPAGKASSSGKAKPAGSTGGTAAGGKAAAKGRVRAAPKGKGEAQAMTKPATRRGRAKE